MKEIGYILSGSNQREILFVVKETEKALINNYYFIEHPLKPAYVLIRATYAESYNPEMSLGQPGPIAGKKGITTSSGKKLEYEVIKAEVIGYIDPEVGKWRALECCPSTWSGVYEPGKKEIEKYFRAITFSTKNEAEAYLIEIGRHRGINVPAFLDLNAIARGHMFVAGMTRSGKSSFVLNLILKSMRIRPKPRFVIFDRRNEYIGLRKYRAKYLPYTKFLSAASTNAEFIVQKLGLDTKNKSKARELLTEAINALISENVPITPSSIMSKSKELSLTLLTRETDRIRILGKIKRLLSLKGEFLNKLTEDNQTNPIELLYAHPILLIDFSIDTQLVDQQIVAKYIIEETVDYAISRKDSGDFAVIFVIEEAQYYAPERGLKLDVGPVEKMGLDKTLIEAISQAGGYNVGFIIVTQRPAYVSKSIISQCNTVAAFRLMSGNDQNAIIQYTEYGDDKLASYLPGLADHEAMVWGLASLVPFPVTVEVNIEEFPRKSGVSPKQAWSKMEMEETLISTQV